MTDQYEETVQTLQSMMSNFQFRLFRAALKGKTSAETKKLMKLMLREMQEQIERL